ncbi:hypothetical protein BHE74_00024437 [Ensete ventricosum]|nr:hypothetical protein BHE74_00024437 [Ensete ventricosum]RZS01021.1 hypothetical protein BHM03_00030822 [Ensete ventricosum]
MIGKGGRDERRTTKGWRTALQWLRHGVVAVKPGDLQEKRLLLADLKSGHCQLSKEQSGTRAPTPVHSSLLFGSPNSASRHESLYCVPLLAGIYAMADTQSVATLIDFATSKIQQLQQAFSELESHSAISLNLKWKELEEHFHGLEKSLKKRFDRLEDQEKEYVTKVTEAQEMLEKQEAHVVSKELASLERLQEKRDAALSSLFDKYKTSSPEPICEGVSNGMADHVIKEKFDVAAAKSGSEDVYTMENGNASTEPSSELMKLCEEMDAEGLHKFISDNRKNLSSIRDEVPVALRSAVNPFILVLDSLKGFYAGEILGSNGKKDGNLLGLRRTCLMLMECLEQLLADSLSDERLLTSDIKEKAKVIAKEWKPKLDHLDIEASSGNSLESHAFLQLLATFDIASEFDQDEICRLIPAVTRRRQTGGEAWNQEKFSPLMFIIHGKVEVTFIRLVDDLTPLVTSPSPARDSCGRVVGDFTLIDGFTSNRRTTHVVVPSTTHQRLHQHLHDHAFDGLSATSPLSTTSPASSHDPHGRALSNPSLNEINERELSALKAVIKCIEEHKLEEQYPVDPLQKRILQLEKAKADKRRAAEAAKPQSKRPRATGGAYTPRITSMPDKSFYRAPPERFVYPYDRQYVYAAEAHHPTLMGPAPYTISPPHTAYYGNGYQVQYQTAAAYLH